MCKIYKNIEYSFYNQAGENKSLTMDVFVPTENIGEAMPLLILAHPGFFLIGNKTDMYSSCEFFVQHGIVCATINYSMLQEYSMSSQDYLSICCEASIDIGNAIRYFKRDSSVNNIFKINPNLIFTCGYSAGALAALLQVYGTDNFGNFSDQNTIKTLRNKSLELNWKRLYNEYSSEIVGLINIAGALPQINFNFNRTNTLPSTLSIHGEDDEVVPLVEGYIKDFNSNNVITVNGSKIIYESLSKYNIDKTTHKLFELPGGNHESPFQQYKTQTHTFMLDFIFETINNRDDTILFL